MITIEIKKANLINELAAAAEYFGSTDWDIYVSADGSVDTRHNRKLCVGMVAGCMTAVKSAVRKSASFVVKNFHTATHPISVHPKSASRNYRQRGMLSLSPLLPNISEQNLMY